MSLIPPDTNDQTFFMEFSVAGWHVEPETNRIHRDGDSVKLEPKVMDLLVYLADRQGQVVSREDMERAIWTGTVVSYDTMSAAVRKLRKALDDDPRHPHIIETLSKRGYRLIVPIQPLAPRETLPKDASREQRLQRGERLLSVTAIWMVPVLLAIIATMSYRLASIPPTQHTASAPTQVVTIAVLPLEDLGNDPTNSYLVDGLTDNLGTMLSKIPGLMVISRESTFLYKDRELDLRQVADNLGTRYLVHGSILGSDDRVRINLHLVDGESGEHLWADRAEGARERLLDIADGLGWQIVASLSTRLSTGTSQDLGPPETHDVLAYEYFLRGRQHFYLFFNREENLKARSYFAKTIDLEPQFAMAHAMLAWTYAFDAMNGWSESRKDTLMKADASAAQALKIDPTLPIAHFVKGVVHREMGEYAESQVEAALAIQYDPNYANAYVLMATLLYHQGQPEDGLAHIRTAIRLNPHHPYNYSFHLGQALFVLGRYQEAIAAFRKGLESNPSYERLHIWLAAALAHDGNSNEARWELEQVRIDNPDFSLQRVVATFPFPQLGYQQKLLDGLRKAESTDVEPEDPGP